MKSLVFTYVLTVQNIWDTFLVCFHVVGIQLHESIEGDANILIVGPISFEYPSFLKSLTSNRMPVSRSLQAITHSEPQYIDMSTFTATFPYILK